MKRSEAIKKISELIEQIFTIQSIEAFGMDELCDVFLSRLENVLGITSPFVDEVDDDLNLICRKWEQE